MSIDLNYFLFHYIVWLTHIHTADFHSPRNYCNIDKIWIYHNLQQLVMRLAIRKTSECILWYFVWVSVVFWMLTSLSNIHMLIFLGKLDDMIGKITITESKLWNVILTFSQNNNGCSTSSLIGFFHPTKKDPRSLKRNLTAVLDIHVDSNRLIWGLYNCEVLLIFLWLNTIWFLVYCNASEKIRFGECLRTQLLFCISETFTSSFEILPLKQNLLI